MATRSRTSTGADPLQRYRDKRDFAATPEPADGGRPAAGAARFVIQKHWASHLHYDFRLELDGTLKSWAVPKGPSLDPKDKRMAVQVEDHPLSYAAFEGEIAQGNYGAGQVIVWDQGSWQPVGDAAQGYADGKLKFVLHGEKLAGGWTLVRMHGRAKERQPPWLLIKEKDDAARPAAEFSVVDERPDSVLSGSGTRVPAKKARVARPPAARKTAVLDKKAAARTPARKRAARSAVSDADNAAASLPDALRAAPPIEELPAEFKPQLATLVSEPPPGPRADWLYEVKFDGYRLLARIEDGRARLLTRSGLDWSAKMPQIARALESLPLASGWLDGEVVAPRADGVPDFQTLQNAFDSARKDGRAERPALVYYLFDLPFAHGRDLRALPLVQRRTALEALLVDLPPDAAQHLRFSAALDVAPARLLASACSIGFEGVIGKRCDAPYQSRRSSDWIKLKCAHRQEFVICGYTDPKGTRTGLGALLLGVHDDSGTNGGALRYAGNVGTGFTEQSLRDLTRRLGKLETDAPPFADRDAVKRIAAKGRHWVEPKLLAEVSFAEWTSAGRVRHAVFHGLRSDKKPRAIRREQPVPPPVAKPGSSTGRKARAPADAREPAIDLELPKTLRVTHGERVVDRSSGATKLDLLRYWAQSAAVLLPHLQGRPVSLLRAPRGLAGETFFQKHADTRRLAGVRRIDAAADARLDPADGALLEIESAEGVLQLAQLNTIELHTWNATSVALATPDRIVFDLDPGARVAFAQVREAALLVRALLGELGLYAFLKTSGGKGLHLVLPIEPRHDWDTVRDFSERVVQHLARTIPGRFVAVSGAKNRVGKIFVDYLRNGFGATTVCAWSLRARTGLGVSVPIGWDELGGIGSGAQFTLGNIEPRRSQVGNAPWHDYETRRCSPGPAIERLARAQPAAPQR